MRQLIIALLIGGSLSACTSETSCNVNEPECPATPSTCKRVIRPLHSGAVYVENVDTLYKPADTIFVGSKTGRIIKAVIVR